MRVPKSRLIVNRQGLYWRWSVYQHFMGSISLLASGKCFRYDAAVARGKNRIEIEDEFWRDYCDGA
jgi:hypothetical protein